MSISLTSSAFEHGKPIPRKHTCEGADVSPPLQWNNLPAQTQGIALICDDPDAPMGTWVHWVLYGLPPGQASLEEGLPADETLPTGARQGKNDFGRIGYGGPCPPPGKPHRYFFNIYALDADPNLEPGASKKELLKAMEGHILGQGELVGSYER